MKHLIITAFAAILFAACNTKETKDTSTETVTTTPVAEPTPPPATKTIVIHDQTPPATPPPVKQSKVEINLTDSGSGIKVRIP